MSQVGITLSFLFIIIIVDYCCYCIHNLFIHIHHQFTHKKPIKFIKNLTNMKRMQMSSFCV